MTVRRKASYSLLDLCYQSAALFLLYLFQVFLGRTLKAAFEYVRMTLEKDSFASMIQQNNDVLDNGIVNAIVGTISSNIVASAEYRANS